MSQPKVSISVPVYNAERYLHQCIDSIINQTLKDIEIVLVDDGSTDGSGAICDMYAAHDSRIKVIHKSNGGSSSARQVGLENSTGLYYTVCDSDDWVELDMYETLYNRVRECDADVVLSRLYTNYPDGSECVGDTYLYTTQEQLIYDIIARKVEPSTCSKLIRRELFERYNISYELGINMGEDALLISKLLLHPLRIVSLDKAYYHYRRDMHEISYTNHVTMRSVNQLRFVNDWQEQNYPQATFAKAHTFANINLCFAAIRSVDITKEAYQKIVSRLSAKQIISQGILTLKSTFVIFTKVLGFRLSRSLFKLLYPIFYK